MTVISESITESRPAAPGPRPGRPVRKRIGVGRTLANGLTLAWRSVMQLKHSPEKLMDVTLMPIVFLVLFLYVFGGVVAGSTNAYLEILLPGLVTAAVSDPAMVPAVVRRLDDEGIVPAELALRLPSLDEVFLTLTGHLAEERDGNDEAGRAA